MKKILFVLFASVACMGAHAQLANTKWKDTLLLDNPVEVIFDFGKDTLTVTVAADGSLLETMSYTVHGQELSITKIAGQSDCDGTTAGKYAFELKDDKLHFSLLKDDCINRGAVLDKNTLARLKQQ